MSDDAVTDLTRGVYRRLYSGFTTGQRINKISLQAEAWFWRVLATVDDFGNGRADPDLCKDATAGHRRNITPKQISGWLREMQSVGLIQFYSAKGEPYLHVANFEETQPAGKNGRRLKRYPLPGESGGILKIPDVVSASDSEDEDDSENDNENELRATRPRSPRAPKQCDEDFLSELQADEAYKRLDVRLLHAKMVRWCKEKNKVPTRARFINWLNREDQPMENGNQNGTGKPNGYQAATERRDADFRGYASVVSELRSRSSGTVDETVRGKS